MKKIKEPDTKATQKVVTQVVHSIMHTVREQLEECGIDLTEPDQEKLCTLPAELRTHLITGLCLLVSGMDVLLGLRAGDELWAALRKKGLVE